MSHCFSAKVEINGKTHEICLTHPPENAHIRQYLDSKPTKPYKPTEKDIDRAVDYYFKHEDTSIKDKEIEDMVKQQENKNFFEKWLGDR